MLGIVVVWVLVGAILGALVAPRQGWQPSEGAVIGGAFNLLGVLFLLVKPADEEGYRWVYLACAALGVLVLWQVVTSFY